jgi:hypothetical protein
VQFKTFREVIEEARAYHTQAQNPEGFHSRDDRRLVYAKAERCYHWCLEQLPEDPFVLGSLGSLYVEIGKWGLGVSLLLTACRLQPDEPANWNALGAGLRRMDKLDDARDALKKSLDLSRDDLDRARVCHNIASTYINEGEPWTAVEWAEKGLKLDPENKQIRFNLGLAQLELGDFANGWDGYEMGRIATTWARNYSHPGREVVPWDGSPGKNLVVFGEQGVGDEVLFAHAIPDLLKIAKSVIIECHPRLVNIFKRSFPECTVYGTRKDEEITWPRDHDIDAKVPIGSLHRFFRRDRTAFPVFPSGYLKPDPALVGQLSGDARLLRVGLSWIGGTRDTHVSLRSMPLDRLEPILTVPGIEFVSLQYTEGAAKEVEAARAKGWNISHDPEINEGVDPAPGKRKQGDMDKLFATIAGLDMIVTVLTSNVHFAGSMGIPAWCLTPIKAPWQFMQDSMPWYPQHRLYRQQAHGEWDGVINTIARDLVYVAEAKRATG